MLDQKKMKFPSGTQALTAIMGSYLKGTSFSESTEDDLFSFLTLPARLYPDSLSKQIAYRSLRLAIGEMIPYFCS